MQVSLVHYSKDPLPTELHNVKQEELNHDTGWKPSGLWVSCEKPDEDPAAGDGWLRWCQSEEFHLDRLRHRTVVTLHAGANVLRLNSDDAILDFGQIYGRRRFGRNGFAYIDWQGVAEHYQGILIYPYSWALRFDMRTFWYYTWDCASGCIWDVSCIGTIERSAGYTKAALTRKSEEAA